MTRLVDIVSLNRYVLFWNYIDENEIDVIVQKEHPIKHDSIYFHFLFEHDDQYIDFVRKCYPNHKRDVIDNAISKAEFYEKQGVEFLITFYGDYEIAFISSQEIKENIDTLLAIDVGYYTTDTRD